MEVEDRIGASRPARGAHHASALDRSTIQPGTLNRIAIGAFVALGAFLVGFVPMWLTSEGYKSELSTLTKTLRSSVLQNSLATATINARRGEFEPALQQTSSFFTDLRAEMDRNESSFAGAQLDGIRSILEQRDETITMLARSDPASADRLTDLYFNFVQVKNSAVPANN